MRFLNRSQACCFLAAPLSFVVFSAGTVRAATDTWTGTAGANWNTNGNWTTTSPGGVPVSGDALVFNNSTPNNTNNNNITSLTLSGVTFDTAAAAYTLNGNGINLGWQTVPPPTGTGITYTGDIVSSSSSAQTINLPITLDPARHAISTGSSRLNLHGTITQPKGSTAIFTDGGGGINAAGSGLANTNGILGGWATIGTDWAALDGSNNVVPYTGYVNVSGDAAATIADAAASNVRITNTAASTPITMAANGTTRVNSLLFSQSGTAQVQTLTIGAGNTLALGQNGGIFNSTGTGGTLRALTIGAAGVGTLTAGDGVNPANITLSSSLLPSAAGIMTINSNITDNGSAPVSVTVMGGYVTPAAAAVNTFSGGLYIVSGRWSQPNASNIGTGPVYIFPGGMINPGAGTPVTISNNLFIAGNGTTENNGLGAVRMFQNTTGNNTLLTGTVTLMADASVSSNGNNDPNRNVGITGKITGPGGLMIGSPTSNANANGSGIVVIGPLTGPAAAPNNYAGDTTINGTLGGGVGSILRITTPDADNIMPHGATGSYAGGPTGNVALNGTSIQRIAVFDLNGSTQTINGLTNTATSPMDDYVESAVAGGHLILGDSNATAEFGGTIHDFNGTLAVTKIGSGTQTFSGMIDYSGDTRIQGGTLRITSASIDDMSDVYISNGAHFDLSFTGKDTIDSLFLGGVPAAIGEWGATTSAAPNKSPLLSGLGTLMVTTLGTLPPGITGDYNSNGVVDAADYVVWRDSLSAGATTLPNRDNANMGAVGPADYTSWKANFGRAAGSGADLGLGGAGSVPEPTALVVAIVAMLLSLCVRSRGVAAV